MGRPSEIPWIGGAESAVSLSFLKRKDADDVLDP